MLSQHRRMFCIFFVGCIAKALVLDTHMSVLRFGLIGFGRFGKHYSRLLQTIADVELVAVCAKTHASLAASAAVLPVSVTTTTDAAEIFANRAIDCVIIATPLSTHVDLILSALNAGKHILVEKPMVASSREAREVQRAVQSHSQIFMVGFQYVYNDYIVYLKHVLDSLGTIQYFRGEHLYCSPIRSDVGCFQDAGVHDLAVLEYLFPGEQCMISGASHKAHMSERDDFTSVTLQLHNGVTAELTTSWFWPEKIRKITVVGDRGMAIFNDRQEHDKLRLWNMPYPQARGDLLLRSRTIHFEKEAQDMKPAILAREPLLNELEHFITSIREGKEPVTNVQFGNRVTLMCEEIVGKLARAHLA